MQHNRSRPHTPREVAASQVREERGVPTVRGSLGYAARKIHEFLSVLVRSQGVRDSWGGGGAPGAAEQLLPQRRIAVAAAHGLRRGAEGGGGVTARLVRAVVRVLRLRLLRRALRRRVWHARAPRIVAAPGGGPRGITRWERQPPKRREASLPCTTSTQGDYLLQPEQSVQPGRHTSVHLTGGAGAPLRP